MLTFTDDYSRKTFVYFLKSKDEVFDKFVEFKANVETQTGEKIKTLKTDFGTEYVNKRMFDYLKANGINLRLGAPYSPELQGVAERVNRSICEIARCMLKDAKLPDDLWAEACSTAAYIKNRSPHSGLKNCTPEQMWTGKRPDIRNLKVFGCNCMVHIPDAKRRKWDPKSELYTFLGYGDTYGCYRVLNKNRQVRIARNAVFFEVQRRGV
jgi:hypothetical protein